MEENKKMPSKTANEQKKEDKASKPETKSETKPQPKQKPESKPESKTEAKAEKKVETKVETDRTGAKSVSKSEVKTEKEEKKVEREGEKKEEKTGKEVKEVKETKEKKEEAKIEKEEKKESKIEKKAEPSESAPVTARGAVKVVEGVAEKLDVLKKYGEPKLEGILKGKLEREFGPKVNISVTRRHRIWISIAKEDLHSVVKFLMEDGYDHLTTIASVDLGDKFELLYFLAGKNMVVTVRLLLPKDKPEVETLTNLIPGATRYEREAMDLMGVVFLNHPDPRRLVLPEDWPEGVHPLRKDWQPPVVKGEGERIAKERELEKKGKEGVLWK